MGPLDGSWRAGLAALSLSCGHWGLMLPINAKSVPTLCNKFQVRVWSEVYSSVIEDTKGYVEKKQASTYEELVAEQEQKAEEVSKIFHTQLAP